VWETSNHDNHLTSYHRTSINIIFDVVKEGEGDGKKYLFNIFGEKISRRKSL